MENEPVQKNLTSARIKTRPRRLTSRQIAMIEEAISAIGNFGEVHLVVNKGRLHYIATQKSFNATNYSPGMIIAEYEQPK